MQVAMKEAGSSKLFSANITADDPADMTPYSALIDTAH
jgi:hypothetical protein